MQVEKKVFFLGCWFWIGGICWIEQFENFLGFYNCIFINLVDWYVFGLMMDLVMMGCGIGVIIELYLIDWFLVVCNSFEVFSVSEIGIIFVVECQDDCIYSIDGNKVIIKVGDICCGWVDSYQLMFEFSSDEQFNGGLIQIEVDFSDVWFVGEMLKGFGGMVNFVKLKDFYGCVVWLLNKVQGCWFILVECCLLIDEVVVMIVVGNICCSVGMCQFVLDDQVVVFFKDNFWQ